MRLGKDLELFFSKHIQKDQVYGLTYKGKSYSTLEKYIVSQISLTTKPSFCLTSIKVL